MKCLDSSMIIDLLKDNKEAIEKLESISNDTLCTTRLNIFEVLFGAFIKKGIDHQKFSEKVRSFIDKIAILELDELGSIKAAKIKSNLVLNGKVIEDTDCLIAGIMLSKGYNTVITRNKNHFNRIEGINVEEY